MNTKTGFYIILNIKKYVLKIGLKAQMRNCNNPHTLIYQNRAYSGRN